MKSILLTLLAFVLSLSSSILFGQPKNTDHLAFSGVEQVELASPTNGEKSQSNFILDVEYSSILGIGGSSLEGISLSFTLLYQTSQYFEIGFGYGFRVYGSLNDLYEDSFESVPMYAAARFNFSEGKWIPFLGFRVGYSVLVNDGQLQGSANGGGGSLFGIQTGVLIRMRDERRMFIMNTGYDMQEFTLANKNQQPIGFRTLHGINLSLGIQF